MELQIIDSKTVSVTFPQRKLRNKDEKNWSDSENQRIFLEKQDACIDGSTGDIVVKLKVPAYLKKKLADRIIKMDGIYFPDETDTEIEALLEATDRMKLGGKTFRQASPIELIQAGILKL